jgi:hypothetical protein
MEFIICLLAVTNPHGKRNTREGIIRASSKVETEGGKAVIQN